MTSTSRDYTRPHRPWPVKLLNALPLPAMGPFDLDPRTLIDAAVAREGLDDFGDPAVLPLLTRLMEAYEAESRLTHLGRFIVHDRILRLLVCRLRAIDLRKRHPEIAEIDVSRPIVITGLARSGTTFLQRLLAADDRLRHLRTWEAFTPLPPRSGPDRRVAAARQAERGMRYLTPGLYATHPVQADGVEEEILLLDLSLLSTTPEATARMPEYSAWLKTQDQRPAYVLLRELMQVLSWQGPTGRWLLKTPHHMEWLDLLTEELPGAVIVHTHRDPVVSMASFCSMIAHGYGLSSDAVDPIELGRHWLDKTGYVMDRALDTRTRVDAVDVHYAHIVEQPAAVLRHIYAAAEMEPPPDLDALITRVRASSRQHAHGRHDYDLADFGLTEGQVRERFSAYEAFRASV